MKIAVAGYGDVGKYIVDEFSKSDHEVVLLTRKEVKLPDGMKATVRVTKSYTVEELTPVLEDCDAVVSTLSGPNEAYIASHLAILEACSRSPKCKRFLPSEFAINVRDFPDQPAPTRSSRGCIREALKAQTDVKWTVFCIGWFMDYLLSSPQCGLTSLGRGWCAHNETKVFDLYGDGLQKISLTSVRDSARALLALFESDANQWTPYTFVSGQTLTYIELYDLLKLRDPLWTIRKVYFADLLKAVAEDDGKGSNEVDFLRIMAFTNCNNMPEDKTLKWGTGVLASVQGRDVNTFLDEAEADKDVIP